MKQIETRGKTVAAAKARKFVELVEGGKAPKDAAKEVGMTIAALRRSGEMARACAEVIDRATEAQMLDGKRRALLRKSRLTELMLQDEDPKVAIAAIRADQTEHGVGTPAVAVQINNAVRDPAVVEALKSLQLEVEAEDAENHD